MEFTSKLDQVMFTTLTLLLQFDKGRPKRQTQCQQIFFVFVESAYLPQFTKKKHKHLITSNVEHQYMSEQL